MYTLRAWYNYKMVIHLENRVAFMVRTSRIWIQTLITCVVVHSMILCKLGNLHVGKTNFVYIAISNSKEVLFLKDGYA